jgi:putative transposase
VNLELISTRGTFGNGWNQLIHGISIPRPDPEGIYRGDAKFMALGQCRPGPGLIHHTDQGRQYSSTAYVGMLKKHGMVQSMSRRGNCYDNAVAESFFSSLKNELVHHCSFKTREEARTAVFEYIEVFYNRQRRHQSLDYVSPVDYERSMAVA